MMVCGNTNADMTKTLPYIFELLFVGKKLYIALGKMIVKDVTFKVTVNVIS